MRISGNPVQEQPHAWKQRAGSRSQQWTHVWDVLFPREDTWNYMSGSVFWENNAVKLGVRIRRTKVLPWCRWLPAPELHQQAPGQGTVNTDSSRTLSHSQASGWILQGLLCLGPPSQYMGTSERLLPLSTAKLNHLGLLALSVASHRSQDSLPMLLSPTDNLHFVRPCLYL